MAKKLTEHEKREQQRVLTTKLRHGDDIYSKAGKKMWADIKRRLGEQK